MQGPFSLPNSPSLALLFLPQPHNVHFRGGLRFLLPNCYSLFFSEWTVGIYVSGVHCKPGVLQHTSCVLLCERSLLYTGRWMEKCRVCVPLYVCTCSHALAYMCVHMHVCAYVHMCIRVCMCVCVCVLQVSSLSELKGQRTCMFYYYIPIYSAECPRRTLLQLLVRAGVLAVF